MKTVHFAIGLTIVFILISWALLASSSYISLIALGSVQFFFSIRSPRSGGALVFFFLPWINALSNAVFHFRAIPALLIVLSCWMAGYLCFLYKEKKTLRLPYASGLIIALTCAVLASAAYSVGTYIHLFPRLTEPVAFLYLGQPVLLKNAAGWALLGVVQWSAGMLFFIMVCDWIARFDGRPLILRSLALGLLPAFGIGLYQLLVDKQFAMPEGFASFGRISAGSTDPNALGFFIFLSLPLLTIQWMKTNGAFRHLLFLEIAAGALLAFLSGSRLAVLGVSAFFVFLMFYIFITSELRKRYAISCALAAVAVASMLFAPLPASRRIQGFPNPVNIASNVRSSISDMAVERLPYWKLGARIALDHAALGTGVGRYLLVAPDYLRASRPHFNNNENSCNYYLQIFAEMGAGVLLLFIVFFSLALGRIIRVLRQRPADSSARIILFAAALLQLCFLNFWPYLHFLEVSVVFWTILAFLWDPDYNMREPALSW